MKELVSRDNWFYFDINCPNCNVEHIDIFSPAGCNLDIFTCGNCGVAIDMRRYRSIAEKEIGLAPELYKKTLFYQLWNFRQKFDAVCGIVIRKLYRTKLIQHIISKL